MAELKKRRDYNRPLTHQEVDGNWDELDRRTKTQRELNTIDKLAGHIESMEEPGGETPIPETIIIPISNGNVEIGEVFGHRFLRDSKLVGFELLCEEAPTGDSIGLNLLINDSTADTVYIPDSETLSEESWLKDYPLRVYRGDKVSIDVFGIGSMDSGTNLRGALKFIDLEQTSPSGSLCIINNIYIVYKINDGENGYWVIKPGLPQDGQILPLDSFDFDIELKFSDDTSEIVNYDASRLGVKTLQKDLTAVTIVDAIVLSPGELFLHGHDDNGYSAVENVIYVENDIHADSITNESSGRMDYVRLNFLIDTVC